MFNVYLCSMKGIIRFISSSLVVLFSGCAQQVPLGGGDKDVLPPMIDTAIPPMGSVNFEAEKIEIEFDEYVVLKDLNNQLLVSPGMKYPPVVTVKGKKVIINIEDTLLENTTYNINCGNAIVDFRESNEFKNFSYIFSTGSFIDTLQFTGEIKDAFELSPQKEVYVFLYEKDEDSIPYKELPRYISRTDDKGHFRITNIKEGTYKLFTLKDLNRNYLFDLPNEAIAFSDSLIKIDTNIQFVSLTQFTEEYGDQYIKETKVSYGKVLLVFNKPLQGVSFIASDVSFKRPWFIQEVLTQKDSVYLWLPNLQNDTLEMDVVVSDTNSVIDTFALRYKDVKLKDSILDIQFGTSRELDYFNAFHLQFEHPLKQLDTSFILLMNEDSVPVSWEYTQDAVQRNIEIKREWGQNMEYRLEILPGAFTDIFGLTNDSVSKVFKSTSLEAYGTLLLSLKGLEDSAYVVEFYKGKELLKEVLLFGDTTLKFELLKPNDYHVKLFFDGNRNGIWDTGKYIEGIQAEKRIFYKGDIKIRANWDSEIEWVLSKSESEEKDKEDEKDQE